MIALRGATTLNKDLPSEVKDATVELLTEIMKRNHLEQSKIVSILFTATKDIRSAYPGKYIREEMGITTIPILHFQEMEVEGALPLCIRVMLYYEGRCNGMPVYLREARVLRPDLNAPDMENTIG